MQLSSEIKTISATTISSNGSHLFWAAKPQDSLVESIREFGQLSPLLVRETPGGTELIAGNARLEALRAAQVPALVATIEADSDLAKGLLYLADNGHRVLDDGMRLAALRYFRPLMDDKMLRDDIMPRLGIKPKSKDAKLFTTWLDLPDNWQAHLATGNVPLAAGATLARMDDTDRAAVEPLFARFTWSRSNAVNILTWLHETSKMTTASVGDVMQNGEMDAILNDSLSPKDAIAKLTAVARELRYPRLSELQDLFGRSAREITAGTRWRMNQPNNFETGGAELTIQVKDAKQLAQAVSDLETMAGLSPWDDLWKLGSSDD